MYVYIIEDFGSSCFTEYTSITIHRTVFQFNTIHEQKKMVDHSITKISLFPSLYGSLPGISSSQN